MLSSFKIYENRLNIDIYRRVMCTSQFDDASDPVDLHGQSAVSVRDLDLDTFTDVAPRLPKWHLNNHNRKLFNYITTQSDRHRATDTERPTLSERRPTQSERRPTLSDRQTQSNRHRAKGDRHRAKGDRH